MGNCRKTKHLAQIELDPQLCVTCSEPTVYDFLQLKVEISALDRVPLSVLLINFRVKINTEVSIFRSERYV